MEIRLLRENLDKEIVDYLDKHYEDKVYMSIYKHIEYWNNDESIEDTIKSYGDEAVVKTIDVVQLVRRMDSIAKNSDRGDIDTYRELYDKYINAIAIDKLKPIGVELSVLSIDAVIELHSKELKWLN